MRVIGVLLITLLAGCASQADLDTWQGANFDELVMAYGPPDKSATLEDGRKLVEFTYNYTSGTRSNFNYATGREETSGGNSYFCRVRFMVGDDNRVETGNMYGNIGGCNALVRTRD